MSHNFKSLEKFLREKEQLKISFTLQEVELATTYKISTIKSYFSKKLVGYLVYAENKKSYISSGIYKLSSTEFASYMSQNSTSKQKSDLEIFTKKLKQRSLDAFILAVENYNRPPLNNRVEAFAIFMINAWELLLKSVIAKEKGYSSLFYNNGKQSLGLRDILKKVCNETNLLSNNNPVTKNIEILADIRDQSIHLLLNDLQPSLSRIFQATVLNYIELYKEIVGKSPLITQGLGLLSLVTEEESLEYPVIAYNYGKETAEQIKIFLEKFAKTEAELDSSEFAIPIEYKLVLTKKESDSDIKITSGNSGKDAIIINKPRNPDETHPYRQKDVIKQINQKIKLNKPFNRHDFKVLTYKHKIKGNGKFHHYSKLSNTHSYSSSLVEKFVELIQSNPQSIQEAKESYKNRKKQKK
ncbi:MAG: DUF3644 domain-containing protein [Cyanobacteria bacterium J06621_8]